MWTNFNIVNFKNYNKLFPIINLKIIISLKEQSILDVESI